MAKSTFVLAAGIAAALTGCSMMTDVTASSRSYLGPQQSGAISEHTTVDTAREVTRLFEVRGFAMIDQHVDAPNGEFLLKFAKGNRAFAAEKTDNQLVGGSDVGSVFYAWITPSATGSTISVLGKPTLAGVEPCTNDGVVLSCSPTRVPEGFATAYLSGHTEAEIAHGLLSQLALEGYAIGPLPPNAPPPTGDPAAVAALAAAHAAQVACEAQRHQMLLKVVAVQDPDERGKMLESVPRC